MKHKAYTVTNKFTGECSNVYFKLSSPFYSCQINIQVDFYSYGGPRQSALVLGLYLAHCNSWWSIWWNENWQGKPRYFEKTCLNVILSTTNPTWTDLELKLGSSFSSYLIVRGYIVCIFYVSTSSRPRYSLFHRKLQIVSFVSCQRFRTFWTNRWF
jgi:hypothetical protein